MIEASESKVSPLSYEHYEIFIKYITKKENIFNDYESFNGWVKWEYIADTTTIEYFSLIQLKEILSNLSEDGYISFEKNIDENGVYTFNITNITTFIEKIGLGERDVEDLDYNLPSFPQLNNIQ